MSARPASSLRRSARALILRHAPRAFLRLCPRATTAELGRAGEELVARALRRAGCAIEARNLRTPWGELDVLARDAAGLVCVEVKTGRRAPMPRVRGAPPVAIAARDRPGARVDARGIERLEAIAQGLARRRRLGARCEVWQVEVGPRPGALDVRRTFPDPSVADPAGWLHGLGGRGRSE